MSDRCHVCDRPDGWENDPHPGRDCQSLITCVPCEALCWGDYHQCTSAAVDWRARSIAAGVERDAALAKVDELTELLEFAMGDDE